MTRKSFFVRLAGMLGLAEVARGQEPRCSLVNLSACVGGSSDGHAIPLNKLLLQPGEEYCPVGHAQKALRRELLVAVSYQCWENMKIGERCVTPHLFVHVCSVCGVVYVPQENKKENRP
jgi:hypothetical protein